MKTQLFLFALATLLFSNGCTKSKSAPPAPVVSQTFTIGSSTSTVQSTYRGNGGTSIVAESADGNYSIGFIFPTAPVPGTYDVVGYTTPATGMQVKVLGLEISPIAQYFAGAAAQVVTVTLNNGKFSIIMSQITATMSQQQSTITLSVKMSASFSEK